MNLKEAFQAQNKLEELYKHFVYYLSNDENVVKVTEKHFRSKSAEGQLDEKLDVTNYNSKIYNTDAVIKFLLTLIDEREKLARAIRKTKMQMEFDIDTAVDVNKKRHNAAEVLRGLRQLKSSGTLQKNAGTGYVFNKEGNQTTYRYDIERVSTIDFDRNEIRDIVRRLQKKADEVSAEIDAALISAKVDYKLPFDMHSSAAEILEDVTS